MMWKKGVGYFCWGFKSVHCSGQSCVGWNPTPGHSLAFSSLVIRLVVSRNRIHLKLRVSFGCIPAPTTDMTKRLSPSGRTASIPRQHGCLGACRTWGIESEKAAEQGQIVTISPAHSGTMVQESGEIWTAETRLQPILPKSDRLLLLRTGRGEKHVGVIHRLWRKLQHGFDAF